MFPSNSTWNQNTTTFAYETQIGTNPVGLYIDTNNSIYTINKSNGRILIWMENSTDPNFILYTQLSSLALSIFVTTNGQIYVGDSTSIKQIIKSNSYSNQTITIATVSSNYMFGLFVDLNNTLYCSSNGLHKVVKKSLNDNSSTMITVAGNGSAGSASDMLNGQLGIFVDTNFDLYVADFDNHRIQLFRLGQTNGTTVAGSGSANITISLNRPRHVILDGNKHLFITDGSNHRIIGSDENGFRCIVACSMSSGATSDKLNLPESIAFDSFGNLFVVDYYNSRIQKFCLSTNFCNSQRKNNDSIFSFDYLGPIPTTSTTSTSTSTTSTSTTTTSTSTTTISTTTSTITTTNVNESKSFKEKIEKEKFFVKILACKSPQIILIPSGSTFINPLKFRRSQDFYIVSLIELNCNDSTSIRSQWILKNNSNVISFDSQIETTFSELFIPARKLPFGIFELELTVTMTKYPTLKSSSSVYVEITPSGITANLVQLGTSMITSGFEQDLRLDPGTYSVDPDEVTFDSKVSFQLILTLNFSSNS